MTSNPINPDFTNETIKTLWGLEEKIVEELNEEDSVAPFSEGLQNLILTAFEGFLTDSMKKRHITFSNDGKTYFRGKLTNPTKIANFGNIANLANREAVINSAQLTVQALLKSKHNKVCDGTK
jgi:hypothetical protein